MRMLDADNRRRIVVLTTSDIHGYIQPYSYTEEGRSPIGFSRVARLIEEQRQITGQDVLYIDNGDCLQGSPLAYYQAKVDNSRKSVMIASLAAAGCDAAVIGNHEFNFGLPFLRKAMDQSPFPWICANILSDDTALPAFGLPYLMRETAEGIRIAVLGLTTGHIPRWEHPGHIAGLRFEDPVETAKRWVPFLREQKTADIVIVSYHGGFERDPVTGEPTETLTGENQGYALCQAVEGIDVLLTGHQHRQIAGSDVNGVCVVQPGTQGRCLGKVTLTLERTDGAWRVTGKRSELISTSRIEPLETIEALAGSEERELQAWLDQPLGWTLGDMRIENIRKARLEGHPFIEWINRVQMEVSGARISCTALFDDETPGLGSVITMRDILANYKFPNTLRVLRVKGQDIRAALEKSAEYFKLEADGTIGVNPAYVLPKPQPFNYDMWEGIEYVLDISCPSGQRVACLCIGGVPVPPSAEYNIVLNSYRAGGGGGYEMFRGKPVVRDIPADMAELLADYIRSKREIGVRVNHNWRVIGGH